MVPCLSSRVLRVGGWCPGLGAARRRPLGERGVAIAVSAASTSQVLTVAVSSAVKPSSMAASSARTAGLAAWSRLAALVGEGGLEDAPVGGVRVAFDQAFALQRGQHLVYRLGGEVAGPGEVGAGQAGITREHAERAVLERGQVMRAQGGVHGGAKRVPRLDQQETDVALDAAVALPDERHGHASQLIRTLR